MEGRNYAEAKDVQLTLTKGGVCAVGMEQRSNYAGSKDVQNKFRKVEFVRSMVQKRNCAAGRNVRIMLRMEEFASDMEQR